MKTSPVKLIIQIPCYNEAQTLPETIGALPRELSGIDVIEYLVIDDGSQDETSEVAEALGVHHIVRLRRHSGLAVTFMLGLESCLEQGADIVVNTDADNQYNAADIQSLVNPILFGAADIVIGDRGVTTLPEFSPLKRQLQRLGSWMIGAASGIKTPDATSGFRAFSKDAALRTIVMGEYSYTLETLIQAGVRRLAVAYVPVRTNPQTRPSRLMSSIPHYLYESIKTVARSYIMYHPLRVFSAIGGLLVLGGIVLGVRYLYFYLQGQGAGHIQSIILAAILTIVGFQITLIGLIADLIGFNRTLLDDIRYRLRRLETDRQRQPPSSQTDIHEN